MTSGALSRDEVETWRRFLKSMDAMMSGQVDALCDMALASLSERNTSLRQRIAQHVEGYSGQLPNHVLDCIVADIRNFTDE